MTITVVAPVKDENGINLMILLNHSSQYSNCNVISNYQLNVHFYIAEHSFL